MGPVQQVLPGRQTHTLSLLQNNAQPIAWFWFFCGKSKFINYCIG
jgi:hypothetical protein